MKTLRITFLLMSVWVVPARGEAVVSSVTNACERSENWKFGSEINEEWARAWRSYQLPRSSPILALSDALAMRRLARNAEERTFAEYWTSQTLDKMGMIHLAHAGFSAIAARVPNPAIYAIQNGALDCLVRIQSRYPTLELGANVVKQLPAFPRGESLSAAASVELRKRIAEGKGVTELQEMVALIDSGTAYERMARLVVAAHLGDHDGTANAAREFLADKELPKGLERFSDTARVLLGRALFSRTQYDSSLAELRGVQKSANELAHSLSDLAWAQLRDEKYNGAIGTVINLQSGALRRTFTPEGPMVMAMAFNELCHYPQSLKAVQLFRSGYEASNRWLQDWKGNPSIALYPKAISFLKREKNISEAEAAELPFFDRPAPTKVASEWIRTPHFIARQDEIKLYMGAREIEESTYKLAAGLQRQMAAELLEFVHQIKPRYDKVKEGLDAGEALPVALRQDLDKLRKMVTAYRRLKKASGPWMAMVKHQERRSPLERVRLVKEVEKELAGLNLRMLLQLDEIAENLHFLEVEIFQGASQDIIWQNAHPDYEQMVNTFRKEEGHLELAQSWNWGSIQGGLSNGTQEVWEDELGSFKTDLVDNCESKDKFLSIKQRIGKADHHE